MSDPIRVLLVAPEASSDVAATAVASRLLARPDVALFAAGRNALRDLGVNVVYDTSRLGQVGLGSILASAFRWYHAIRHMAKIVRRERIDVIVLFSCRRFSMYVMEYIGRQAPPAVWVYPPGDWMHGEARDEAVLALARTFVCGFEWQARRLEGQGVSVVRVPHHTLQPPPELPSAAADLGLESATGPVVAGFPGSRREEVNRLLPVLIPALERLAATHPGLRAVISQAPSIPEELLRPHLAALTCEHVVTRLPVRTVAGLATVALTCCGTATTEVALGDCPQVVVYRASWLSAKFTRAVGDRLGLDDLSMINLGLRRRVVTELIQTACTTDRVVAEVSRLLDDPSAMAAMRADYAEFRGALGQGDWDAAAEAIVAVGRGQVAAERTPGPVPASTEK